MTSVLMVVTSHGEIGGLPTTGVWFSEFSEPFDVLRGAGIQITVASPRGGPAPVDPRGYPKREEIADVRDAMEYLNATRRLTGVDDSEYDAIFMPGGHGPMFDLAADPTVKKLIARFWDTGRPVGAVCHGPASLLDVAIGSGRTLLSGRRVTGFTQAEDAVDPLFQYMPFSLEKRMTAEGAHFVAHPPRSIHVEVDGRLITGQNPASARKTAEEFLHVLRGSSRGFDAGGTR